MVIEEPQWVVVSTFDYKVDPDYIRYSDISPDSSREFLTINADAIGVSIHNLLSTVMGERLNLPDYGVRLDDFIFELMDSETEDKIMNEIFEAVTAWEPRVKLDQGRSSVTANPDSHSYTLNLFFLLIGLEDVYLKYSGTLSSYRYNGNISRINGILTNAIS